MSTLSIVVADVTLKDRSQTTLIHDDQMVQAFPSDDGFGLEDQQCLLPGVVETCQHTDEESIGWSYLSFGDERATISSCFRRNRTSR